jgi:hypothetical protein
MTKARIISLLLFAAMVASLFGKAHPGGGAGPSFL